MKKIRRNSNVIKAKLIQLRQLLPLATLVFMASADPSVNPQFPPAEQTVKPHADWPHWPAYQKTPLDQTRPQKWHDMDHTIHGWDWSLPPGTKPAPNGLLAIYRESNIQKPLNAKIKALGLPINQTIEFWVKWRDLEPKEGVFAYDKLKERIIEAEQRGCCVIIRILSSATTFAPDWIKDHNIPLLKADEKKTANITNYDIEHPEFHKRYLLLVKKLGESGIPLMPCVRGAYVGYHSPAYGDEGIGPHGKDPDTIPHVRERLDAWGIAFKGQESKVYMGGSSRYGYKKGFGTRRGFVEMFLYHIPSPEIGQLIDPNHYLYVDDSVELLKRNAFHGEENEEYEEQWATKERGFRFGKNTDSYPYRYYISNLRTLQMQCNHVLMNPFALIPEQLVWLGQSLGRTVNDSPDIWCALRESYIRNGGTVKNMERWLYQRDSAGYETTPVEKINHPINMWMVQKDKNFDFIARSGKKIGLAVDDRWNGGKPANLAIKSTYFDKGQGKIKLSVHTRTGIVEREIALKNTGNLLTATFHIDDVIFPNRNKDYDLTFTADKDPAVLSFVRIVKK